MRAERIAGLTALVAGLLLVLAIAGAMITGPLAGGGWSAYVQMGPGMMGMPAGPGVMGRHAGPGMMGFGSSGPAATAIPGAPEVRVQAENFGFTPKEIRLPAAGEVNLTLTNPTANGVVHDLTVPALGIRIVAAAGETRTVGLRRLAAGRYDGFCTVPGHADLGMRASIIVE